MEDNSTLEIINKSLSSNTKVNKNAKNIHEIYDYEIYIAFRENRLVVHELNKIAKERGTDRSSIIREAIRKFLNTLPSKE